MIENNSSNLHSLPKNPYYIMDKIIVLIIASFKEDEHLHPFDPQG